MTRSIAYAHSASTAFQLLANRGSELIEYFWPPRKRLKILCRTRRAFFRSTWKHAKKVDKNLCQSVRSILKRFCFEIFLSARVCEQKLERNCVSKSVNAKVLEQKLAAAGMDKKRG